MFSEAKSDANLQLSNAPQRHHRASSRVFQDRQKQCQQGYRNQGDECKKVWIVATVQKAHLLTRPPQGAETRRSPKGRSERTGESYSCLVRRAWKRNENAAGEVFQRTLLRNACRTSSRKCGVAWRDGRVEVRRTEAYSQQYVDGLSAEPARRVACRSSDSTLAAEVLVGDAGLGWEEHAPNRGRLGTAEISGGL